MAGSTTVICQERPPTGLVAPQSSEEDLVHFGDIVDVDVVGGFEFDWRGTITTEGYLAGLDASSEPIAALCRSEAEIAADVAKGLGKILREPRIVVKIIDRTNRAVVRLEGAVRTPTRFRLRRKVNLRELLVLAGGLTDSASGGITIFRPKDLSCRAAVSPAATGGENKPPQDNGSQTINIKISEILSGQPASNPQILSGDMISVTRADPVYVIGAVNNPRPVYPHTQITVSRAIAAAGGLAKDADSRKVSIFRRSGGETTTIDTDLDKIKRNESEDEILKPFDIIDVAAKGAGKRKYPPMAATDEKTGVSAELPLRVVD